MSFFLFLGTWKIVHNFKILDVWTLFEFMLWNFLLCMRMFVCQSNGWIAVACFRCHSASSTTKSDVAVASPERVFLTFTVDDVFETIVHEHRSTSLSLCELKGSFGWQPDHWRGRKKRRNFVSDLSAATFNSTSKWKSQFLVHFNSWSHLFNLALD